MALATERDIHASIVAARQTTLIRKAETRVVADQSCRSRQGARTTRVGLAALILLVIGAIWAPVAVFGLLAFWAILSLVASTALKLACFVSEAGAQRRADRPAPVPGPARLPAVSMMVPLYAEDDIAPRLIRRIGRIDYPKELLDVLLVVEEDDHQTQAALAARDLPRWMRIVVVPAGPIRTKPRALNYALDFCRGSIVGIWDAEDAPEPAQIRKVVLGFHHCGPDVACLQGILDFDNSRHNWLTRCFTVEYAAWFRAVLPGLARLGFVVPLGGTTLFFRRETIEKLGGWDAHNVTEDADLGLRLARHGYRTELIDTVTDEEPNAHPLTWIRQRSRWQKGYAMTWASHMRDPARLWRELGAKRFWGVQILFLGSLSQSFLAPVLWTFWLLTFGLPHPLGAVLPSPVTAALIVLFVVSELINIAVGLWATRGPKHRHLMKWVPSLHFYFPLAALSSYKALYEWLLRPFYWDKTAHGVVAAQAEPVDLLPLLVLTNPAHVPAEEPRILSHPARHALVFRPARLHLAPVGPEEDAHRETATVPSRSDRVALSLVTTAPRPPRRADRRPYVLGSAIAHAPRRSGIEFQPCFEGLGDM